jgi:cobaltochelatase CobS
MNNSNAITLKTTEDVKAFEKEVTFYNRYIHDDFKWATKNVVKANLANIFKIDNQGWIMPDAYLPHSIAHIPSDLVPKVDKGYEFDPKSIRRIFSALTLNKPIMLAGPQGSGKTTLFEQFYARLGLPCARVQCTSSMDSDYLFGFSSLIEKNGAPVTAFNDGQVTGPRRHHVNLLLDEVTHLSSHVSPDLNTFLEMTSDVRLSGEGFKVDSTTQVVKATPFHNVWMTSNTGGREECDAGFSGNNAFNTATLDRCIMIDVDYLKPEIETKVLNNKVLGGHDWIENTIAFANLVRDGYKIGELPKSFSTRGAIDFLNYKMFVGDLSTAFCDTILAKFEESDRLQVAELFRTAFDLSDSGLVIPSNLIKPIFESED